MQEHVDYTKLTWRERGRVRQQYVTDQKGKCWYCFAPLIGDPPQDVTEKSIDWKLFPGGERFLLHPIHLQHNHNTNMTEGAVHAYCNAVLWQYYGM